MSLIKLYKNDFKNIFLIRKDIYYHPVIYYVTVKNWSKICKQ